MTTVPIHDSAFIRAAQRVLEHLSTTSGLATWAVCRFGQNGCHTLAVDDARGSLQAQLSLAGPLGQGSLSRIASPIILPDGEAFGELVGFDDRDSQIVGEHTSAQVRAFALLLGALAAAETTLYLERRATSLNEGLSDPLSGLATAQGWAQRLRHDEHFCRAFGEPAAIMLIEVDDLGTDDDHVGATSGTGQLQLAGSVVQQVLAGRHLAARIDDERLGVLMLGVGDDELDEVERATRRALSASDVSASIGIGRRRPETGLDGAIAAANGEIDRAHTQLATATAAIRQSTGLLDALERGEMSAYFQPIVDLRTGRVAAIEALARWHSTDGIREPDQFLEQMQQAGLLGALFDRILDDGLERLVEFRRIVPNLQLAVNFEFDTKPVNSLLDTVRDRLQKYGLPAEALSLELSERQTFELPAAVRDELFAVAELGVELMLDDFGTGFASLETLTTLPVTGVKLDRRFTSQVVKGERESIVVKAMIALAAETGLTVIAEGIETQLQCDRLVRLGCRVGQGYLFALPQPADSLSAVLAAPLLSTF